MKLRTFVPALGAAVALCAFAGLDGSYVLPADHSAIGYNKTAAQDAVSRLARRIASGETRLTYDTTFGYLPSLLQALHVPESSQILVFSKTSFQAPRISPRMPRALYFNDEVSVGYVRGGDVLELAAVDPKLGVVFYTLDQERLSRPKVDRQEQCLQCHAAGSTLGVPGLVIRSVYPDRHGMPIFHAGTFLSDHRSPLEQRWGGWYVSGSAGGAKHMGNTIDGQGRRDITDLKEYFDTGAYLRPSSDIVALMVVEHQTRMTNLITRVGWETRMALHDREVMNKALGDAPGTASESTDRRINNAVEELVKYMLFTDETPLTAPVTGASGFAEEYSKMGPRDKKGRSLRELDLKTRLLRYRCSPLIYSEAFRGLPDVARRRTLARVRGLAGPEVVEILRDTGVL
ncbi:MAG: hypothetical protein SGI92_30960 [Bryobacteraceae bacterium]|nr:hypothetical protein [Bryobacteraceae bacterium]